MKIRGWRRRDQALNSFFCKKLPSICATPKNVKLHRFENAEMEKDAVDRPTSQFKTIFLKNLSHYLFHKRHIAFCALPWLHEADLHIC